VGSCAPTEGFGWDWDGLWRAVHGEQAAGDEVCRGGGATVRSGGGQLG
jgi:hypothetical protein